MIDSNFERVREDILDKLKDLSEKIEKKDSSTWISIVIRWIDWNIRSHRTLFRILVLLNYPKIA